MTNNVEKMVGFTILWIIDYTLLLIFFFIHLFLNFSISLTILQHFIELHDKKYNLLKIIVEIEKPKSAHVSPATKKSCNILLLWNT